MERRENLPDTYRCRACGSGTLPPILFVRCRQALEPCPSGNEDLRCWRDSGRLEKFPRRLIVLRLQNDEKGAVLVHHCTLFGAGCPAHISAPARVILIKV